MLQNKFNKKIISKSTRAGFGIMELMIAIAIFAIGVVSIGLFLIDILYTAERANNLTQGVSIANEGLEAIKAIRDSENGFEDYIWNNDGDHGLYLNDDVWEFNDEEFDLVDLTPNGKIFTRVISISEIGDSTFATTSVKFVESMVSWPTRTGTATTTLSTYITNWER